MVAPDLSRGDDRRDGRDAGGHAVSVVDPDQTSRAADTPTTRTADRWWLAGFRPLLLRLHFYVGLFVGPFLLVAAVTGLLYTIAPQLESSVHAEQLRVPAVGTRAVPLADQVTAARAAVPEGTLESVRPPSSAEGTTRVVFASPETAEGYTRTAFIDPYTGQSRGVLDTYGEWLPVRAWLDDLHRNLHLGEPGRIYSELAASWLWVLALSGLLLWWARARKARRDAGGPGRLRRLLLPRGGKGRGRLLSWHGSIGVWALLGMLFLSATGMTWSTYAGATVSEVRSALSWQAPSVTKGLPSAAAPVAAEDQPAAVQRVLTAARTAGLDGPVEVSVPSSGAPWKVSQTKRSWPVAQDSMALDPQSGTVLNRIDFADWPVMAQLANLAIDTHMGLLFGVPNQIALALIAVSIIAAVLIGYRMWWLRRPTRGTGARLPGPPGAGRAPSRIALVTMVLVAIAVGVAFPVLGGSLLLFCGIDAVWQATRRAGPTGS
ncbi:peptidase [Enemella evansiae]|nr:peptidase [Enemella evansiae]